MSAKILFVDDDEENLVVCEAHCRRDFQVLTCTSAEQAMQLLAEHEVGVIVADQRMPETTGVELLERVRLQHPDVVRLIITAYSDLTAAIAAINRGQVRRYIKKPWESAELRAELKDALEVYEMGRRLRALSARLRETERVYSLGIITASVAHELRNPVGWISDNLRYVRKELVDLELALHKAEGEQKFKEIDDALKDAQVGAERIMEIVRGIELPNRESTVPQEVVDLDSVIGLTLNLMAGELRHTTKVVYEPKGQPKTRGSQTKIGQIVLNLLVNAVQALADLPRERRLIKITLDADEQWAHLTVADSGPGVPLAAREKIFDVFYTTKGSKGTGLGLAICQQITVELAGTLQVDTDAELGGACFKLKLPLVH